MKIEEYLEDNQIHKAAAWPSVSSAELWPLAWFVHGSPEFKSSATLVNSQLVCLGPVGIRYSFKSDTNYLFQSFSRSHEQITRDTEDEPFTSFYKKFLSFENSLF